MAQEPVRGHDPKTDRWSHQRQRLRRQLRVRRDRGGHASGDRRSGGGRNRDRSPIVHGCHVSAGREHHESEQRRERGQREIGPRSFVLPSILSVQNEI